MAFPELDIGTEEDVAETPPPSTPFPSLDIPEEAVASPSFPDLGLDTESPTPSQAQQQFQATQGLDEADPTKLSPLTRRPSGDIQTPVAEVTSLPVGAGVESLESTDPADIQRQIVIETGQTKGKGSSEYKRELKAWEELQEAKAIRTEQARETMGRERGEALGRKSILAGEGLVSGATFGLGGLLLDKLEKASGGEISAETRGDALIEGIGNLIGAVATGGTLASGMQSLTKKLGLQGVKQMLAIRLGTSGIQSGLNEAVNILGRGGDVKDSAKRMAQAVGASLFGAIPENAIPAGATNFIGQVIGDFVFDFGTDSLLRRRFKDTSFKDWFINEELPQLVMSLTFASKDLADGAKFEANRQKVVSEITNKFRKDVETNAPKPSEETKQEMAEAKEQELTPQEQAKLAEIGGGELDVQTKTAFDSLNRQLTQKVEENTATEGSGEIGVSKDLPSSTKVGKDFDKANAENDIALQKIIDGEKKNLWTGFKKLVTDADADVKDTLTKAGAKDAVTMKNLIKGASASAALEYKQARTRINKALSNGLGKGKTSEKLLADYVDAKRTVEASKIQEGRGKVLKSRQGITAESAQKWLDAFERNNRPQDIENVKAAADEYWGALRNQLDQSYEAGLINKKAYDFMVNNHKNYSPRLFVDALDAAVVGGKRGDLDSGIKSLDEGSEKAMIKDPAILMEQVMSRTQSRIFKNRANQQLTKFVSENPDAEFGRSIKNEAELKRGEEVVTSYVDGEKQMIAMPKALAESWKGIPPALSENVAQIIQWGSGTKVLKALATGVNPEFVLGNLPRDIAFAWFNSGQYSKFMPKAALEMVADYAGTIKDAATKTGAYADFVKEGGGMDYLSTEGKLVSKKGLKGSKGLRGMAETAFDILGYLGETSEIATRLAVRQRGIKNGLSPTQATAAAREMLDFAQGGQVMKTLDNGIPYLNAAIQGTRGTLRSFKTDWKTASVKASQLIAMGVAQAWAANARDDDAYESISDREKASKWIWNTGLTKKDKDGNNRHMYVAIPKDQGQQIFSAMGQSLVDGMNGRPWSKQMINAITQLIPVEFASTDAPIANAIDAYFHNYDSWTQRNVWNSYQDVSPSMERNLTTPAMATGISDIAKKLGVEISPERLATATSKLLPNSNPVVSGVSNLTSAMTEEDNDTMVEKIRKTPFANRVVRFSYPSNPSDRQVKDAERFGISTKGKTQSALRTEISEAKRTQGDARQTNNLKADDVMSSQQTTMLDFRQWLNKNVTSIDERKRLWMRQRGKHPDRIKGAYNVSRRRR